MITDSNESGSSIIFSSIKKCTRQHYVRLGARTFTRWKCCKLLHDVDMASKGSITAGVKNIQYFHDPGALFDPQRDVMDKGLFKNVCITTTACYRFQLPGYRQLGKQSRCFTDRMIMSCSGPIPAQKARTNSVPGAIFSHLMFKRNVYHFHRFSWEKKTV